jgi:hypothetical protein
MVETENYAILLFYRIVKNKQKYWSHNTIQQRKELNANSAYNATKQRQQLSLALL